MGMSIMDLRVMLRLAFLAKNLLKYLNLGSLKLMIEISRNVLSYDLVVESAKAP